MCEPTTTNDSEEAQHLVGVIRFNKMDIDLSNFDLHQVSRCEKMLDYVLSDLRTRYIGNKDVSLAEFYIRSGLELLHELLENKGV